MRKYLDFIRRPFEYDKSLCIAWVVMLLSIILLHCSGIASALGSAVLAGLYVTVASNLAPRYYAIATPVLYVMTIVLLSWLAMFSEGFYNTPWTKFAGTTISPIWFAGLTVALVMSFIYSWKNLTDTKKASIFGIAITLLLVLVATSDVVRAVLLAVAVCITFYACRIGKDRMFFNCGMTLSCVILYVVGAASFGHNPFGGSNPQYDSEALLRFVPVLTSIYVVYQTTHRLIDRESSYIRLLGIGSAYILLAESISDIASSMLSIETSSAFIRCMLYGIILSCIGYRKNTVRIES